MKRFALLIVLAACAEPGTVHLVDGVELDAGAADATTDAPAGPVCEITVPQRYYECKHLCFDPTTRCPGALGADCMDECVLYRTGTYYCPEI